MKPRPTLRSLLLGCSLISTFTAYADTLTWDNGAATGNWNTSDLNWTGSAWSNAAPDDAVFGATGVGPVTLSQAITAGSLTFNTAGYTIDTSTFGLTLNTGITANQSATIQSGIGGSIILGADNDWSVTSSTTLAVSSPISGGFSITKSGDGTLDLTGANTYSGGTTISAGTVSFGSATALGTGALTFDNGGTGTSTAVFSIAGTHTNAINVAVGSTGINTIRTTNDTGSVNLNGAVTINTGTTLRLDNSGSTLEFGSLAFISGAGGIETTGTSTGNIIFRGDNTYSGGTLLSGSGVHVPAASTIGPAGSPTAGNFGTGTLTINNATFRSTTVGDTTIGNAVTLSGNLSAINVSGEKSLIFSGPVTLTGTRTITSTVGNTVAGKSLIISGAIGDGGNGYGLIKEGTGNLTLSGPNTYTGGTTLNAGVINASTGSAFGAGDILVTGNSRINVVGGQTYSNKITVNASRTLTLQNPTTSNSTATFSGVLAGSGALSLPNTGTNGVQGIVHFTNTANTFTGNVNLSASGSGDEHFRFASLGDGGTFTFAKNGNRQLISHSGASNITFSTRTITIATTMNNGGTTDRQGMDGGGSNPVSMFANDGTGTVSFTQNMVVNNFTSTYGVLYFGGTNTGNNTFGGNIGDTSNATSKLAIGKFGSGKWILSGSNTYEGDTLIAGGTLSVGSIDVAANAQPLGKGAAIQLGVGGSSSNIGTLEYTGGTGSTNKQVRIGTPLSAASTAAGSILNNGSGPLTFTNSTFNPTSTSYTHPHTGVVVGLNVTAARTLTLGGSYTGGINEIQGVIQNNTAAGLVSLTKTGNSTWQLSGNNTYTGTTAIQGGVLVAGHINAIAGGLAHGGTGAAITLTVGGILGLGAGDFTRLPSGNSVTAGRIAFLDNGGFAAYGADRTVNFGGSSGIVSIGSTTTPVIGNLNGKTLILGASNSTHKVTVTNTLDFGGGSRTIQVNDGLAAVDAEISGILQPQSGGTAGLIKTGDGTLLLSSNSITLNGQTNVTAGKLIVNGNISTSLLTTVSAGAALGGSGIVGAATIDGVLAPGNSIGTLTATGDVTWNHNDAWVFELGSAASTLALATTTPGLSDLLDITGGNDFLKGTGSSFTFDFAGGGMAGWYKLVDWSGTTDFVGTDFLATNLGTGLTGTFTVDGGTSALYLNVIPEPNAALLGGIGMLILLRRRRP